VSKITRREALKREKENHEALDAEYWAEGENKWVSSCVSLGKRVKIGHGCIIGGFTVGDRRGSFGVVIEDDVHIGHLSCIMRGLQRDTTIKTGCRIYQQCNIGHDTLIGENTTLRNNVVVLGHVEVGDRCEVGCGARIRDGVKIGNDVFIAMGAIVVKDVPDGSFVMSPVAAEVVDRERPYRHPRQVT